MKKQMRFLATLSLLLTTLFIAGCHGSKGLKEFKIPEQFDQSKNYEITFWAKNDTNKSQTAIYQQAIDSFETQFPNIKVNLRLYTDYGKIYNDVITNIATNTTPNVCITYPDHIATYSTGTNLVVPLEHLIEDEKFGLSGSEIPFDSPSKEEIIPKFLEECTFDGHIYALPYMRSTEACYVNKTFVEALGYTLPDVLTWDFVWDVSEAAMKKDADGNFLINGQKVMIPFIYKSTDNMMIQMLKQKNAGYSSDTGEILLFHETTKELLETIAKHAKTGAFSTFKISSYPANFLNAGQCIFAVDSTAGATWMGTHAPLCDISEDKIVDFETAVMTVPQFDPQNPKMISQGPSVCVFNKADPQEVLASWMFAQYLLTNEVQIPYSMTEGYVPVVQTAQNSPEYQDYLSKSGADQEQHYEVKIQAVQMLLSQIDQTFVTPVFNGSPSLRDAAGYLIESTVKGVRRGQILDDLYLEKLFDDASSLYRLDQIGAQGEEALFGKKELGPLPKTSVILLSVLGCTWGCILLYEIRNAIKKKRNHTKSS